MLFVLSYFHLCGWLNSYFCLVESQGFKIGNNTVDLARNPVKRWGNAEENWDGSYGWHGEPVGATNGVSQPDMGMDQYLLIPFLGGWTSINPSYFDVNYRGTRFWHTAISPKSISQKEIWERSRRTWNLAWWAWCFFFELKSCRLPLIWGQPHLQPFNLIVPKFGLFPFRWPWLHWGYLPQFDVENPFNVDQFNQINHGFRMGKHLENQVWSWKKTRLFRIYLNLTGKIHG